MTVESRTGIWIIVLGALAIATVIFLGWATSGFKNWDASTWFNYWGKGAAGVHEPFNQADDNAIIEQNSVSVSFGELTWKSFGK